MLQTSTPLGRYLGIIEYAEVFTLVGSQLEALATTNKSGSVLFEINSLESSYD